MNKNELAFDLLGSEEVQDSNIGRVEQLLRNINANEGVMFYPIGLVALRGVNSVNIARDKQERVRAMQINSRMLSMLYERYQVNDTCTVAHVSALSASTLKIHVERFSPIGIGFTENATYANSENPSLVVTLRPGERMSLETGYPPRQDTQNPPVPQSYDVEVHAVLNGEMPFQYLD